MKNRWSSNPEWNEGCTLAPDASTGVETTNNKNNFAYIVVSIRLVSPAVELLEIGLLDHREDM
jgi:hypothetical protein